MIEGVGILMTKYTAEQFNQGKERLASLSRCLNYIQQLHFNHLVNVLVFVCLVAAMCYDWFQLTLRLHKLHQIRHNCNPCRHSGVWTRLCECMCDCVVLSYLYICKPSLHKGLVCFVNWWISSLPIHRHFGLGISISQNTV